jgi:hypothetical protein
MLSDKAEFEAQVVHRRHVEFERLKREREERLAEAREVRKHERMQRRKMEFYKRQEEEKVRKIREEEGARKRKVSANCGSWLDFGGWKSLELVMAEANWRHCRVV